MIKSILKSIGYILSYFVIQIIMMNCFSLYAVRHGAKEKAEVVEFVSGKCCLLLTIVANLVAILLFVWIIKRKEKKNQRNIVHKAMNKKHAVWSILSALTGSMVIWTIMCFVKFENTVEFEKSMDYFSDFMPGLGSVMLFLTVIILQPIIEEMICRKVVISELRESYSKITAIIISAVFFGLMHGMAGGVPLVIGATVMAIIFGVIYVRTDSLFLAIAGHMAANLADYIMPYVEDQSNVIKIGLAVIFAIICFVSMRNLCKCED